MNLPLFRADEKGKAVGGPVQKTIVIGATLFIGILIIFNLYQGVVAKGYTNESLGDATNDSITYLVTDYTPISSSGIVVRNSTGDTITQQATAPGWQLVADATGNVSINYTGVDVGAASDATYIDYTQNKMTGTALTAAEDVNTYLWIGFGFLGLGLLVMGAMYVMQVIRQMGE